MNWIFYILFLVVAIVAGYLIAYLSRDELVQGRKWFQRLAITFFVVGIGFSIFGFDVEAMVCSFIVIVSWISYIKSKDNKFVKLK